ncbi:hypothetical protein, partial [Streptomyces sp. UNOB3_S3]|uniref:hypothetical protein n=1 Tax=Streptomyces sp. UNOB3_S3 TaxID=2871682 RepID=UPI001E5DB1AC
MGIGRNVGLSAAEIWCADHEYDSASFRISRAASARSASSCCCAAYACACEGPEAAGDTPPWAVSPGSATAPTCPGLLLRNASRIVFASDETSGIDDFTKVSVSAASAIQAPALWLNSPSRSVALAMSAPHSRKASPPWPSHSTLAMWAFRSSPSFLMAVAATLSLVPRCSVPGASACSIIARSCSCVFHSKSDVVNRPLLGCRIKGAGVEGVGLAGVVIRSALRRCRPAGGARARVRRP